jgi:hypothetical protein
MHYVCDVPFIYFLIYVVYKRKYCDREELDLEIVTDLHPPKNMVFRMPSVCLPTCLSVCLSVGLSARTYDVRLAYARSAGRTSFMFDTQKFTHPRSEHGEYEHCSSKKKGAFHRAPVHEVVYLGIR